MLIHTEERFLPCDIDIIRKYWGEGKGSSVRLLEQNSYVSAHGVNNFLPWFDPWPLTSNTDPARLTSTGLSTQWSDPVSNQSDSVRPRSTGPNCLKNELCWVTSCVCRCVLTLKHHRMTLELSTSSSSIWWKPSENNKFLCLSGGKQGCCFFVCVCIDISHCSLLLLLLEFCSWMQINSFTFWEMQFFFFPRQELILFPCL